MCVCIYIIEKSGVQSPLMGNTSAQEAGLLRCATADTTRCAVVLALLVVVAVVAIVRKRAAGHGT